MNWSLRYVTPEAAFPREMSDDFGIPLSEWWAWDEPYKVAYREYAHNQAEKEAMVYAVNAAVARSSLIEKLDPGWKAAITAHYGAIAMPEYAITMGESRMARFGRAAAWRNTATYGTLDETRHGQIQAAFAYGLLPKEPRMDWAHKLLHTNDWGAIAVRSFDDDIFTANDAVRTAIQLTFATETGFTNLQFLGMAAEAMRVGDVSFGSLLSSIQTDEARHAQQGEPTLKVLLANGKKAEAQQLIDVAFWRNWRLFALLAGPSMDYYTPLESREMPFKEFCQEWIGKQFLDQITSFGLEKPWYWDDHFLTDLNWWHHAIALGLWYWRATIWFSPHAGMSSAERQWLEQHYPGWTSLFGQYWDESATAIRAGKADSTFSETLPTMCNMCQIPVVAPAGFLGGYRKTPGPLTLEYGGRKYQFCSEPCQWIFEQAPERYAGHLNILDRFLAGYVQPPTMEGALQYMGVSPEESGQDADGYNWAYESAGAAAG
ncbi:YHS domain-containing protein [Mycobacterium sp. SM1]|uniref:YHS domain-containing protein n=1 Tax=Mycobacterium sp. SM1 TaxID=2816243 RepID=UPI001F2BAA9C|nr:YHS domain-containing protein [Mycobacterium sp. SM1]